MLSEIVSSIDFSEYDYLIKNTKFSTFYHSKNHIKFLETVLGLKSNFIIIKEKNELIGVMPYFEKKDKYGIVINSLPFFGSYGGAISNKLMIDEKLVEELNYINKNKDVLSSVIIDNPFHNKNQIYEKKFIFRTSEERLIQCTVLKNKTNEMIWKNLEQRTRRSIRKSEKNGIKILIENINQIHMKKFYQLHVNTMKMKDGKYKPKNFFPAILKNFEPEKEYDIFIAMMGDKPIAYLLVFYYKNFAEYYLPAYDPEFLSLQATSHLIWESMKKAQNKKIDYYNFGGTWKNQEELYRFKRGWAANDFNYKYFIFRDLDRIKEAGLKEILKKYEYFYVCPFNDIK